MNKLNEILKPKIEKQEAIALLKLICRRFADIMEEHRHLCVGEMFGCEECWAYDSCDYVDACYNKMEEVVSSVEKALDVPILLDWDAEFIIITMWDIKPDNYEKGVFKYTLRAWIPASPNSLRELSDDCYELEGESISSVRKEWRADNELIRSGRAQKALKWFFER
jgi:hypothetical protein